MRNKKRTEAWCKGWVAGWNAQAEMKERTCRIETRDNLQDDPIDGDVWLECSACHWQMEYADAPTMPLNYCPNCGAKVIDND